MLHNVFRAVVGLGGKKTDPLTIERPGTPEPPRRNNVRAFAQALRSAAGGSPHGE